MNATKLLYQENSELFAILTKVMATGSDEFGNYVLLDKSIYYPQGGGQPSDIGHLSWGRNLEALILSAKFTDTGVRYYINEIMPDHLVNTEISMRIFQDRRRINSAYHSAGHWLSQIVVENLELPLYPIKGHHYPNEAYIEFEGDIKSVNPDTIDQIKLVMRIDLQANLKIKVEITEPGSKLFESALLPKNFKPPVDKPLRFTQIDNYRWLPCGGTHVEKLRDIKAVIPIEFVAKGGKLRLKYRCEMWEQPAD